MRHHKKLDTKSFELKKQPVQPYKLSIVLPQPLWDAVQEEAGRQLRSAASLVRQTLAEKFRRVA